MTRTYAVDEAYHRSLLSVGSTLVCDRDTTVEQWRILIAPMRSRNREETNGPVRRRLGGWRDGELNGNASPTGTCNSPGHLAIVGLGELSWRVVSAERGRS